MKPTDNFTELRRERYRWFPTQLLLEDKGTAAVEYALMLALIVAVCIGSISLLGRSTNTTFQQMSNAIEGSHESSPRPKEIAK